MLKKLIVGSVVSFVISVGSIAAAQAACSVPYTLTNGTTADATQVMNNFTSLAACAAPIASPSFTGNVGIGTTASNILDIVQNQNASSVVTIQNTNTGGAALGTLILGNGVSGTQLVLYGSNYSTSGIFRANGGMLTATGAGGLTLNTSAQPIYFSVSNAEIARFGADGSFLVNSTSSGGWCGCAKLEAVGSTAQNALSGWAQGTSSGAILARVDDTSSVLLNLHYGTGTVGSVSTDGSSVTYNTTSDARLKNVLKTQSDYRHVIEEMWVGDFEWKKGHGHSFGILAQQAYPLYPTAITKPANEAGIWQADYGKLAPLALWGVKNLYTRTKTHENQLAIIEREVESLSAQMVSLKHANDDQAAEIGRLRTRISALQGDAHIQTAEK